MSVKRVHKLAPAVAPARQVQQPASQAAERPRLGGVRVEDVRPLAEDQREQRPERHDVVERVHAAAEAGKAHRGETA